MPVSSGFRHWSSGCRTICRRLLQRGSWPERQHDRTSTPCFGESCMMTISVSRLSAPEGSTSNDLQSARTAAPPRARLMRCWHWRASPARSEDRAKSERKHFLMRVLITGGAGIVGSHLDEALLDRGDEVFIIDNL